MRRQLPRPPLKAFFVEVQGRPGPGWAFDPPERVVGFYRVLGLTVRDENDLVACARAELAREHAILERIEEVWAPDFESRDADLADLVGDPSALGTWYTSGHAFFGDNDETDTGQDSD